MRYTWGALIWMMGWAPFAAGTPGANGVSRTRRKFVPQAVVVAKQKLLEISNGLGDKRRRDLLDTLEALFADFGVEHARSATNDILVGRYGFLRGLSRNDRLALAPVVADVKELFPEEAGTVGRLKAEMPTLLKLRKDENPTVAERAQWLFDVVNGLPVQDISKREVVTTARLFLRRGRAGLEAYPGIRDDEIARLREHIPILEAAAKEEREVTAEQAKILLRIASRIGIPDFSEKKAKLMVERFLEGGGELPVRYHKRIRQLSTELLERLSALERFAKDSDPVVAERAKILIEVAKGQSVPRANGTLDLMVKAFLRHGRAGLADYQSVSTVGIAKLTEKLPELELLAEDNNPRIAHRAGVLVRLVKGKDGIGLQNNTLTYYMNAFLNGGRKGLGEWDGPSEALIAQLKGRSPELTPLVEDEHPTVAHWARILMGVVRGEEVDVADGALNSAGSLFLERGRAGLVLMERSSRALDNIRKLTEKAPILEKLLNDENLVAAQRALILRKLSNGEEIAGYSELALTRLTHEFLKRGRDGLLATPRLHETLRAALAQKLPELGLLTNDPDEKIAGAAKVLLHVMTRDEGVALSDAVLEAMASAFLERGRIGLKDYRRITERMLIKLREGLPSLESLSLDKDLVVARRAKMLMRVAAGKEITDYSIDQLRTLISAFLHGGRAGLLGSQSIPARHIAALVKGVPELVRLTSDPNPTVASNAHALLLIAQEKEVPGYTIYHLRRITKSFVTEGRAGLLHVAPPPALMADERVSEISQ